MNRACQDFNPPGGGGEPGRQPWDRWIGVAPLSGIRGPSVRRVATEMSTEGTPSEVALGTSAAVAVTPECPRTATLLAQAPAHGHTSLR
jgi:hypothetical protein